MRFQCHSEQAMCKQCLNPLLYLLNALFSLGDWSLRASYLHFPLSEEHPHLKFARLNTRVEREKVDADLAQRMDARRAVVEHVRHEWGGAGSVAAMQREGRGSFGWPRSEPKCRIFSIVISFSITHAARLFRSQISAKCLLFLLSETRQITLFSTKALFSHACLR